MLVFKKIFCKNGKSKLHFGDCVAVLNNFLHQTGGSISFLWKLVLKLESISSRSPLFFFVHLLQFHQQPTGFNLRGFYCAYHMLKLKDSDPHMEVLSWDPHLYNLQLSKVLAY
jgi:hypothetical protein